MAGPWTRPDLLRGHIGHDFPCPFPRRLDKDGDGIVTKQEAQEALRETDIPPEMLQRRLGDLEGTGKADSCHQMAKHVIAFERHKIQSCGLCRPLNSPKSSPDILVPFLPL